MDSFYRPPPLTSYHHLLADPASASAATRPLLLAAGLYGATSLSLPAPPIPPPPPIPGVASSEDHRRVGTSSGGPLDLSHLASSVTSHSLNAANGVDLGANGGGKLGTAASVHSLLQLHKSAGDDFELWMIFIFEKKLREGSVIPGIPTSFEQEFSIKIFKMLRNTKNS